VLKVFNFRFFIRAVKVKVKLSCLSIKHIIRSRLCSIKRFKPMTVEKSAPMVTVFFFNFQF